MTQGANKTDSELHIPVLLTELMEMFAPVIDQHLKENPSQEFRYFDGTFGRGGHLKALLEKYPTLSAVAMDQDPQAIEYAQKNFLIGFHRVG